MAATESTSSTLSEETLKAKDPGLGRAFHVLADQLIGVAGDPEKLGACVAMAERYFEQDTGSAEGWSAFGGQMARSIGTTMALLAHETEGFLNKENHTVLSENLSKMYAEATPYLEEEEDSSSDLEEGEEGIGEEFAEEEFKEEEFIEEEVEQALQLKKVWNQFAKSAVIVAATMGAKVETVEEEDKKQARAIQRQKEMIGASLDLAHVLNQIYAVNPVLVNAHLTRYHQNPYAYDGATFVGAKSKSRFSTFGRKTKRTFSRAGRKTKTTFRGAKASRRRRSGALDKFVLLNPAIDRLYNTDHGDVLSPEEGDGYARYGFGVTEAIFEYAEKLQVNSKAALDITFSVGGNMRKEYKSDSPSRYITAADGTESLVGDGVFQIPYAPPLLVMGKKSAGVGSRDVIGQAYWWESGTDGEAALQFLGVTGVPMVVTGNIQLREGDGRGSPISTYKFTGNLTLKSLSPSVLTRFAAATGRRSREASGDRPARAQSKTRAIVESGEAIYSLLLPSRTRAFLRVHFKEVTDLRAQRGSQSTKETKRVYELRKVQFYMVYGDKDPRSIRSEIGCEVCDSIGCEACEASSIGDDVASSSSSSMFSASAL